MRQFKNVLVIAPHTDDGEIGAGGYINKLYETGCNIYYACYSIAEESIPDGFEKNILEKEVLNATNILGIKPENVFIKKYPVRKLNYYRQDILEDLTQLKKTINPDLILTPTSKDIHQDHKTIYEETIRCFKNKTILGYEILWNILDFESRCFIVLSKQNVEVKIKAISEYKSQIAKKRYSNIDEIINVQAKIRGLQIDQEFAECYEVIRLVDE